MKATKDQLLQENAAIKTEHGIIRDKDLKLRREFSSIIKTYFNPDYGLSSIHQREETIFTWEYIFFSVGKMSDNYDRQNSDRRLAEVESKNRFLNSKIQKITEEETMRLHGAMIDGVRERNHD